MIIVGGLHQKVADFCKQIAGPMQITAISVFDCNSAGADSKGVIEVILVILDFQPRLMSYVRVLNGRTVVVFAVDQWIFERDVERGFLGEATVGTLVFPHTVIAGGDYMGLQEILLKKRLILELLENLVVGFPELSEHMRIKPEYFMYEIMLSRVRVFPPLAYCLASLINKIERKDSTTFGSYVAALEQLGNEKKIVFSDDYVMIPKKFVPAKSRQRVRLINISKNAPRAIFTSLLESFPQLLNFFAKSIEGGYGLRRFSYGKKAGEMKPLVDPLRYVFVPTANGLVSLADRVSVEDFARKVLLADGKGKITVEPIGGVLNDVYLVRASSNGNERKLLIKRFKDWSGIKWFPLNIWALGARTFAVLGRARLERECAISELLQKEGFDVPRVLHVSHSKRLVFMEYIDGENLSHTLRRLTVLSDEEKAGKELAVITKVGATLGRVHSLNIALGDTKPENVIVDAVGNIHLIDFEQASSEGDKVWDVAEFLYYSGHFLSSLKENDIARKFAQAFINGYLKSGGNPAIVRKAGGSKYTRVFSIFTMPSVILAISEICRRVGVS